MIPLVVASERGCRLNRLRVIPVRGCVVGVVGRPFVDLTVDGGVRKSGVSRSSLESGTVGGDSPVGESLRPSWGCSRVAADSCNLP